MANRYLKVGGSNLLDGTTLGNAWETCLYAATNLGASNTLNIDDGSYETRDTDWSSIASGSSGSPTTVQAINSGSATLVLATGLSDPTQLIQLPSECHYITFDGLILDGNDQSGTLMHFGGSNASSHINVTNCTLKDTKPSTNFNAGQGIQISRATNCLVEGCTFSNIDSYGVYNNNGPNTFRSNTFDTCKRIGITAHSNSNAYSGVVIERNLFKNCGFHTTFPNYAVIVSSSVHTGCIVRNNIFWANRRGLVVSSNGHTIVHNLFYANTLTGFLWSSTGLTIRNNIALENGTNFSGSSTGNTVSHNQITGTATDYFDDPANGDFTLLDNATTQTNIIDQGTSVGIDDDYDGNPRPIGAAVDIGPFELGTVAPPDAPVISHSSPYTVVAGSYTGSLMTLEDNDSNTLTVAMVGEYVVIKTTPTANVAVTSP